MSASSGTTGKRMVGVDTTLFTPKIAPPRSMTKDAKKIWKQLVETIPNENLVPSDMPLLEVYCETMVSFRNAKAKVEAEGEVVLQPMSGNPMVNPWLTVMNNMAGKIGALCTKLRLSPSSRMKVELTKGKPSEAKPTTKLGGLISQ